MSLYVFVLKLHEILKLQNGKIKFLAIDACGEDHKNLHSVRSKVGCCGFL